MHSFARRLALLLLACGVGTAHAQQCVTLDAVDMAATQSFDTLATTGTSATLPAGWAFAETGTNANALYAAGTGSGTAGDTYSFGSAGSADRALGMLRSGSLIPTIGACYTNNTGAAINALDIAYIGEQWRLGAVARADRIDFQYSLNATSLASGTWVDVNALDFNSPFTATVGARDGNAAGNRTALTANISSLSIASGANVWIRWTDSDVAGSDDGLSVDEFSLTARGAGGGGQPTLSIADLTLDEGDSGTRNATFTVQLSSAAGTGGVTFDIATADDTATSADGDYTPNILTAQTIPAGSTSYTFNVTVHGDTRVEPNESFLVNITNVSGAIVGDGQARATIVTDDFTITAIHEIQGAGATSPLVGQKVTTLGVVTGRKSNGFFLQSADSEADGNPATSQGVYVFTGTAPPVQAAVGNRVRVSGTVIEFIPAGDPGQLPFTELGTATVVALSAGNALPTPVELTTTFPDPANPALDQLEPVESMRVTAASFTVVAPTRGSTSEPNATGSSNGQFNLVVTGSARPFREPGIQNPDPAPGGGSIPPIPRWDFNPELLFSDSDGIGAARLDLAAGATLTNYVGPMDYGFRRYGIYPDPAVTPTIIQPSPTAARLPSAAEFTVASYNLERFFDTLNDAGTDDPVLTPVAYANRLNKASLGIRDFLNTPDILGVVEVEKLSVLQDLANKISADAIAAGQPDPQYVAYLEEGNDIGGIDVGFLVKSAEVAAGIDRVEVLAVTQQGKNAPLTNPDGSTGLLNDRPPLQLDAVVHYADRPGLPITVFVVHQRSLNGAEENNATGDRVRNKRQKQAEYLAGLVQGLQAADPDRNITLVGDFNAFEFNDGLVDAMNVVTGTPSPDETTVVPGDGVDLVTPDLLNLASEESADQRYSFVFEGNAQSLDHVLINQALGAAASDFSLDHARINADFPEINRNNPNSASRLSDHDPAVAYFAVTSADLGVSASAAPQRVSVGGAMTFNATVSNAGPDAAQFPGIGFAFDAELTDLAVAAPSGWNCDVPTIGGGQTSVACASTTALANAGTAMFQLTASASASEAGNAINMAVVVTSQTDDPNQANNAASATVNVRSIADLAMSLAGPAKINPSADSASYRATLSNHGPQAASNPQVLLEIDVPQASVTLLADAGWQCVRAVAITFSATCSAVSGSIAVNATAAFDMVIARPVSLGKPVINLVAGAASESDDPQPANDVAHFSSRVVGYQRGF